MPITLCLVYDFLATENIFTLLSNKMRGSEDKMLKIKNVF